MNDIAERIDLNRFAADGCPHVSGETQTFDLLEVWGSLDDEWGMSSSLRSNRAVKAELNGNAPRSRGGNSRPGVSFTL